MMARTVRLEDMVGRRVRDVHGRPIGRLEEVIARREDRDLVIEEYRVGTYALLERFADGAVRRALLAALPFTRPTMYRVPWHAMDVSVAVRPRLLCSAEELERVPKRRIA